AREMIVRFLKLRFVLIACIGTSSLSFVVADEAPGDTSTVERQALLIEMRAAVAAIKVTEKTGEQLYPAKLVDEPIFRYSDEQRFIRDATMWVWTEQGR